MELLGASLGGSGGPSRKELLEALEAQRGQLAQYQARLRDVVRAYKGLRKEKEALEGSLRALSLPGPDGQSGGGTGSPGPQEAEEEAEEEEKAEEEKATEAEEEEEGEPSVQRLKAQLSTLTAALATVSREKSRAEASFQADKRRLRQEMEEAGRRAQEEHQRLEGQARAAREQLAETKARLLAQQQDRAQEQSDHALMLRELQRLLQSERAQRQEAERGMEDAREALAGKASAAERAEEAERLARRLGREVEDLEGQLRALRQEKGRPDPRLQALQAEVDALRGHFQAQLLQEMRKTAHAEERINMEEQRAASLEAQISEASELLGNYEKAKQRDQLAIQRLRERLAQLDLENKTLALAASGRCPLLDVGLEESSLDVNVLKDRMEKLRELLRAATKQDPGEGEASPHKREAPEIPEVEEEEEEEKEADGEKVSVVYYQRELKRLKEEFEHYKQEQQKSRPVAVAHDGSSGGGELVEARAQLAALREKYVSLRLSHEELVRRHQEEAEGHRQELARIQQRHREELERARRDSREEALQLEEEVRRQRERALAVLAEKDQELDRLRALAWPYTGLPPGPKPPSPPPPLAPGPLPPASPSPASEGPLENLTQALRLSGPGEPPFLLYTEQLARRAVELSALRQEKRRLEGESRRLQERLLAMEERHREEVGALRSRLQKSARDQGREGANLEYLKNVFFRFLTLADGLGRQQTLGAILTVLHFSPEEREAVLSQAGGSGAHSWWPSGKR